MKVNELQTKIYAELKKHDYKLTSPRKVVIDALINMGPEHYTVEDLYDIVEKMDPNIGVATVYRTVNMLYDLQLVTKLDLNDGYDRYELVKNYHHHHHLICDHCGKTTEVMEDHLDDLEEKISKQFNFKITGHFLKFRGICSACQKRMEKNEKQ